MGLPTERLGLLVQQFVEQQWLIDLVVVVLMPDVSTDNVFVEIDSGNKIPTGRERLSLVESVGTFDLLFHPGRRFAFDNLYDAGDRFSWCREENHADVVVLDVQLDDFPMPPFADRGEDSGEFAFDRCSNEDFATVLRGPDELENGSAFKHTL